MTPQIKKAVKSAVKIKIAVQGPSGSGKTYGALALAKNLAPTGKVLAVDTENESASLYADRWEFDTIAMHAPYTSAKYLDCINAAVENGYEVLVIDSITHEWDGDGGILRRKEKLDLTPNSNSYTNWAKFTPEHSQFIEAIKQAPIPIIATMRSKTDYVLEDKNGKKVPRKVGMAPIQRDGVDYEFSIVFDVSLEHKAWAIKNRTGLFGDEWVDLTGPEIAQEITAWQNGGAQVEAPKPTPAPKASGTQEPDNAATPQAVTKREPPRTQSPAPNKVIDMLKGSLAVTPRAKPDGVEKAVDQLRFTLESNPMFDVGQYGEFATLVYGGGKWDILKCYDKAGVKELKDANLVSGDVIVVSFKLSKDGKYKNVLRLIDVERDLIVTDPTHPHSNTVTDGNLITDDDIPF